MKPHTLWQELASHMVRESLDQLRSVLAQAAPVSHDVSRARKALSALETGLALAEAEVHASGREDLAILALLNESAETMAAEPRRKLARRLRSRELRLDAAGEVRLRDLLLRGVADRLRITNPRYITARQRRAESSY